MLITGRATGNGEEVKENALQRSQKAHLSPEPLVKRLSASPCIRQITVYVVISSTNILLKNTPFGSVPPNLVIHKDDVMNLIMAL